MSSLGSEPRLRLRSEVKEVSSSSSLSGKAEVLATDFRFLGRELGAIGAELSGEETGSRTAGEIARVEASVRGGVGMIGGEWVVESWRGAATSQEEITSPINGRILSTSKSGLT